MEGPAAERGDGTLNESAVGGHTCHPARQVHAHGSRDAARTALSPSGRTDNRLRRGLLRIGFDNDLFFVRRRLAFSLSFRISDRMDRLRPPSWHEHRSRILSLPQDGKVSNVRIGISVRIDDRGRIPANVLIPCTDATTINVFRNRGTSHASYHVIGVRGRKSHLQSRVEPRYRVLDLLQWTRCQVRRLSAQAQPQRQETAQRGILQCEPPR